MATDHDDPTGTRERDTATAGADAAPTPTADPAVTVEVVPLDTLTPLTDNPRTHTSRGIDFLKASLGRVGAARSGVTSTRNARSSPGTGCKTPRRKSGTARPSW